MARIEARLTPTHRWLQPLARPVTRPTDGLGFRLSDSLLTTQAQLAELERKGMLPKGK